MTKPLNIGMIGYGFMSRTHSNAYNRVSNFFDTEYKPVLKAACGRDAANLKAFAERWGYESTETDWRKLVARPDIDVVLDRVERRRGVAIGPGEAAEVLRELRQGR